jgi:hypothetical protein
LDLTTEEKTVDETATITASTVDLTAPDSDQAGETE